jgi:hypothetical protein
LFGQPFNFLIFRMNIRTIFGVVFTIIGTLLLLISAYALLQDGVRVFGTFIEGYESLVPIILGLIFFGSGIRLISN